ncbi:MAG: hypothetical protein LBT03_02970 [Holosporales bacterium]|jgi:hypothetical protein|nr:hypothetical protein [Holosporales bacterium]
MKSLLKMAAAICLALAIASPHATATCENATMRAETLNIGNNGSLVLKPGVIFQISDDEFNPETRTSGTANQPGIYIGENVTLEIEGGIFQTGSINLTGDAKIIDEGRGVAVTKDTLERLREYYVSSAQVPYP